MRVCFLTFFAPKTWSGLAPVHLISQMKERAGEEETVGGFSEPSWKAEGWMIKSAGFTLAFASHLRCVLGKV